MPKRECTSLGRGRLNTVDPAFGSLLNPQGWNRYSYALNDPVALVDPSGLLAAKNCSSSTETAFNGDGKIRMGIECDGGGGGWNVSAFFQTPWFGFQQRGVGQVEPPSR